MNRDSIKNIATLTVASCAVALGIYEMTLWFFSNTYLAQKRFLSSTDMVFSEGAILILAGILLLMGSDGISPSSLKAAMLASTAKAIGGDVVGPSEMYRKDAWKPKGHTRFALVLIMAGVFLLLAWSILVYIG